MSDNVNNPSHYCVDGYECFDVMKSIYGAETVKAFCLANSFKYLWRMNRKNGLEDAKKAQKYLGWYIEMCEGGDHDDA